MRLRVGIGYDVHALVENRKLILGGVEIPHPKGLDGHSDADVLIVLDRVDNYSREIDKTSELTSELSLEYGISLSRVFATEEQWRKGQTNFFQNLREEAVPA